MDKITLDELYQPLMELPSMHEDKCVICGRTYPLEQHHPVFRSQGELYKDGRKVKKPTLTLCGIGNVLCDENGTLYCHGAAHHRMLHFKNVGGAWAYLRTKDPMKYQRALELDGWQLIDRPRKAPRLENIGRGYLSEIPL